MASAVRFENANRCYRGTMENSVDLHVWHGAAEDGVIESVSCWALDDEELAEIRRTGRVWLRVAGRGHPHVKVQGTWPFVRPVAEADDG